jgi:hypothetical protein
MANVEQHLPRCRSLQLEALPAGDVARARHRWLVHRRRAIQAKAVRDKRHRHRQRREGAMRLVHIQVAPHLCRCRCRCRCKSLKTENQSIRVFVRQQLGVFGGLSADFAWVSSHLFPLGHQPGNARTRRETPASKRLCTLQISHPMWF